MDSLLQQAKLRSTMAIQLVDEVWWGTTRSTGNARWNAGKPWTTARARYRLAGGGVPVDSNFASFERRPGHRRQGQSGGSRPSVALRPRASVDWAPPRHGPLGSGGRLSSMLKTQVIPPAAPAYLQPGEIVAERYRLERELGRGSMGVVWAAIHVTLGQRVAIKPISGGADRLLRRPAIASVPRRRPRLALPSHDMPYRSTTMARPSTGLRTSSWNTSRVKRSRPGSSGERSSRSFPRCLHHEPRFAARFLARPAARDHSP